MYCLLVLLHTKACGFHVQPLASHYKKDAKNGNFCSYNTWYICIRTLILATIIECGCIQLCVLEFVNFLGVVGVVRKGSKICTSVWPKYRFKFRTFLGWVQVNSKFSFDIFGG